MNTVKIFLSGSSRLRDMLYSSADGGANPRGVREIISERYGEAVTAELDYEVSSGMAELRKALEAGESRIVEASPGVLIVSVDAELDHAASPDEVDRYHEDTLAVIRSVKTTPGSHIIVLNASTIDPGRVVSNYQREAEVPVSLRAHKYDLAVMRLSFEEGISIVDVDRLLAEQGAAGHVTAFQEYSNAARETIAAELIRIIDDYGFFDDRPLLPQVGREA